MRSDGTEHGYHQGPEDKHGKPIGPKGQSSWLYSTPWAIRKMLVYVQDTYKPADVWVTENGASAPGEAGKTVAEAVKDSFRVGYYQGYMDNVCKAVADGEGGCCCVGRLWFTVCGSCGLRHCRDDDRARFGCEGAVVRIGPTLG